MSRPPRGVQVECNAPVSSFAVRLERNTAASGAAPNAAQAAEIVEAEAANRTKQEAERLANFRQETLMRLRAKARAKREADAMVEAAVAARTAEATDSDIIQRAAPAPLLPASPDPSSDAAPPVPSQLALMRFGLSDQAFGARDLLLTRCELPMPLEADEDGYFEGVIPPSEAMAQPAYQPVHGVAAPKRFVASASAKSLRLAVANTAARADRQQARDTRQRQEAEAKRALERAELVEAVMAERETAGRTAALRAEMHALEEEAALREEEQAIASVTHAEQQRYQKVVESERFFDALREQLREEAARAKRPLPPLCCCGLAPLENHTENCARNCIFFNNPAAYGRALSGLFVRPIVLD